MCTCVLYRGRGEEGIKYSQFPLAAYKVLPSERFLKRDYHSLRAVKLSLFCGPLARTLSNIEGESHVIVFDTYIKPDSEKRLDMFLQRRYWATLKKKKKSRVSKSSE